MPFRVITQSGFLGKIVHIFHTDMFNVLVLGLPGVVKM